MGAPSSSHPRISTSVSVSKSRHRSSQSLASLSLEKISHQGPRRDAAPPPADNKITASGEKSTTTTAIYDRKARRRAMSSMGGVEDIVKEIGVVAALPAAEEGRLPSKVFMSRAPAPNKIESAPVIPQPQQSSLAKQPSGDERLMPLRTLRATSLHVLSKKLERSSSNKTAKVAKGNLVTEAATSPQPTIVRCRSNSSFENDEEGLDVEQFEAAQEVGSVQAQRIDQQSSRTESCIPLEAGCDVQSVQRMTAEDSAILQNPGKHIPTMDVGEPVENKVCKQLTAKGNEPVLTCLGLGRPLLEEESQLRAFDVGLEVSASATGGRTLVPLLSPVPTASSKSSATDFDNASAYEPASNPIANGMTRLGTSNLDESNKGLKYLSKVTVEVIGSTSQDFVKVVSDPLSALNPEILVVHDADGKSSVSLNMISSPTGILPSMDSSHLDPRGCAIPPYSDHGPIQPHIKEKFPRETTTSFPIEKVTEEELTEAAFLSSVGWSQDSIPSRKCLDTLHHPPMISSDRGNGSSKCPREIQCGSKVTNGQSSVEVKDSTSTGCSDLEVGVHQEAPALVSGSFVASRILKVCPDNRVEVPADLTHSNKKNSPTKAGIYAEQSSEDSCAAIVRPGADASCDYGKTLSRKFPGMTAAGKVGQNAIFKKGPMLDSLVNLSNILWYPTNKAIHHNLEPCPGKENVESRKNFDMPWDRDVVDEDMQEGRLEALGVQELASTQVSKKRDRPEELLSSVAKQEKGCQLKKAGHIDLNNGVEPALTTQTVYKPAPKSAVGRTPANTCEKPQNSSIAMLHVHPQQSLEECNKSPTSFSHVGNPSFSSFHQDRLWEEQAEAYSSGGRGSPGCEDDANAEVINSISLTSGISSVESIHSALGSQRRYSLDRTLTSPSTVTDETCRSHDVKKGKKNGRPRTPLRSLLAQDNNGKSSENNLVNHQSRPVTNQKRSNIWSSCICCSRPA